MAKIATNVIQHLGTDSATSRVFEEVPEEPRELAMAQSVCVAAERMRASCIVAHTLSGKTARLIAQQRPARPIIAITPFESTSKRLSLYWGVECLVVPGIGHSFLDAIERGDRALVASRIAKEGDLVVITAGIPEGRSGGTNVMKAHVVGS